MLFMFIPGMVIQYHDQLAIYPNDKEAGFVLLKEPCVGRGIPRHGAVALWSHRANEPVRVTRKSHFNHIVDQYAWLAPGGVRCSGNQASDPGLWSEKPSSHFFLVLPASALVSV
jgi:hypothetical protein